MSLTLSCKLVEVFAVICAVFFYKIKPRSRCTLASNPTFSVAPVESPRYDGLQSYSDCLFQAQRQEYTAYSVVVVIEQLIPHWFQETEQELSFTHQSPTSSASSVPDFTSVEIPLDEYPARFREPQYDAVVISADEDAHIAETFRRILMEFITLEVCLC